MGDRRMLLAGASRVMNGIGTHILCQFVGNSCSSLNCFLSLVGHCYFLWFWIKFLINILIISLSEAQKGFSHIPRISINNINKSITLEKLGLKRLGLFKYNY